MLIDKQLSTKKFCSWHASRLTWYPQPRSIFRMSREVTPNPRSVTSRRYRAPTAWWSMYNDGDDDDETTTKRWWWWWWSKSRSRICERNFNYETRWWWWWYVSVTDLWYILHSRWWWWWWSSLVHRSVNGTSIMKKDDGDDDMFLSQICSIYFDRKMGWWWWWWSSLVHRSVNGPSIAKKDDGGGNMFLSVVCQIYFDRKIRWWWWWWWSGLVHRSVNGTSSMKKVMVMVICFSHWCILYTAIEK